METMNQKMTYNKDRARYEIMVPYSDRHIPSRAGFAWDGLERVWWTAEKTKAAALIDHAAPELQVELAVANEGMKILTYNREREQYEIRFSYQDKDIPASAGFRWKKELCLWWTKDTMSAARLLEYAQDQELRGILAPIRAKMDENIVSSLKPTSEIQLRAPAGLEYRPFQKAGIEFMLKNWNALLADEMGLGKTIQGIGVINNDDTINTGLVVCPASLRRNWRSELTKWLCRPLQVEIISTEEELAQSTAAILITSYNRLSTLPGLKKREFDILLLDEAHYIKNKTSQRGANALEIADNSKRRIFITGTPIMNKPMDIYPLINKLGFPMEEWPFRMRYIGGHKDRWGWKWNKGGRNLGELQLKLRATIMLRRKKADVLTELPSKTRQIIVIGQDELSSDLKQHIRREQDKYMEALSMMTKSPKAAFAEITKLRHETARKKVKFVIDHIKETLESTEKVVVFAIHQDVLREIKDAFGEEAVLYKGGMTDEQKDRAKESFQNDPSKKVFAGSLTAAGVGLTLTAASTVILAELDWVPANLTQAEDRCHRIGQKDAVLVQHIVLDGSIDQELATVVVGKQEVADKATNADRSEEVQKVLETAQRDQDEAMRMAEEMGSDDAEPDAESLGVLTEMMSRRGANANEDHRNESNGTAA